MDGCLDRLDVQKYATNLMNRGYEVWIVTSRPDIYTGEWLENGFLGKPDNDDLYQLAEVLGIRVENIFFTCYEKKGVFFKGKDFIMHLDDKDYEINSINKTKDCVGISVVGSGNWKAKANRRLKKHGNTKN